MIFFAKIVIGLKTLNGVPRISNEIPRTSLYASQSCKLLQTSKTENFEFYKQRKLILYSIFFIYLLIYILITYLFTYLFIYFPKMSLIKLIELVTCYLICPYL